MADDRPVVRTEADAALARARKDPNPLKALRSEHAQRPAHTDTVIELLRVLAADPSDEHRREAREAITVWQSAHGSNAVDKLPRDLAVFAGVRAPEPASAGPPDAVVDAAVSETSLSGESIDGYSIGGPLGVTAAHHVYVGTFTPLDQPGADPAPILVRWLPREHARHAQALFSRHREPGEGIVALRDHKNTSAGHCVAFYRDPRRGIREGATIASIIAEPKRFSADDRIAIIARLAEAIARLHEGKRHHGDLRPEFAIARRTREDLWVVDLLPGWPPTGDGTRVFDAERASWFGDAEGDGRDADFFSLATIAERMLAPLIPANRPLAVFVRDALAARGDGRLSDAAFLELFQHLDDFYLWGQIQRLSEWQFQGLLGAGSLGVVFWATHPHRGLRAVKFLRSRAFKGAVLARFTDQTLTKLRHEHLVYVEEAEQDGVACYEIAERLQGKSLTDVLADEAGLSETQLLRWMQEVCEACTVLHMHDAAHLDLRPSNIFIATREDGTRRAVLLDYRTGGRLSDAGAKLGAFGAEPAFVAPELRASSPSFSRASDVFSAGRMLVAMMRCARLAPTVEQGLQELAGAMVAPVPADRPAFSVVFFRLQELPTRALPPAPAPAPRSWWPVLAAIAVVACAALGYVTYRARDDARSARSEADTATSQSAAMKTRIDDLETRAETAQREAAATRKQLEDANAAKTTVDAELQKLKGHEDEVTACTQLAAYDAAAVQHCLVLGSKSIDDHMAVLRDAEVRRLVFSLNGTTSQQKSLELAQKLQAIEPSNLTALTALLAQAGSPSGCAAARSAADAVFAQSLTQPQLVEGAWSAVARCGRPDQRRPARAKLAEISADTRPLIDLLKEDPLEGIRVAKVKTSDATLLCGYLNGAINELDVQSSGHLLATLQSYQKQLDCKGTARLNITGDDRSFVMVRMMTASGPSATQDRQTPGSVDLTAPHAYRLEGRWQWPGRPETVTKEREIELGPDDKQQVHLRRVVAAVSGGKAKVSITDEENLTSVECPDTSECDAGVMFLGRALKVTLTADPGDDASISSAQGCTLIPTGCELTVHDNSPAQNNVQFVVKPKPTLMVAVGGAGQVTVTPTACAAYPCKLTVGTRVTLTAVAAAGQRLDTWEGCPNSTGATCTIDPELGRRYNVSARFEADDGAGPGPGAGTGGSGVGTPSP